MKRFLKWVGYVLGGFVLVIALAVATVYAVTSRRISKTYPTAVESVAIPNDAASIERGRHLTQAVAKCTECHGSNLSGGMPLGSGMFAKLSAPNLTAGKGGIAGYTDADYVRSIRYAIGRDGKPLLFMPAEAFNKFSDSDLGAIIAYLKSLPPADMAVQPARSIGPIARMVYLLGKFPLIPVELVDRTGARSSSPAPGLTREYGEYLVETGGCKGCHLPTLGGEMGPNLTPGGPLKSWSEADFMRAIRTGKRPDGTVMDDSMPWKAMTTLTDDELKAMWMYIHTVQPVPASGDK